jgi:hypothetical protein
MTDALATHPQAQLVPAGYAEKAMASLMQLHTELMDEKERRVDLFRRLMEREQSLAELKLYVKVLEERLATKPVAVPPLPKVEEAFRADAVAPAAPKPPAATAAAPKPESAPAQRAVVAAKAPVPSPPVMTRPRPDGWKTW